MDLMDGLKCSLAGKPSVLVADDCSSTRRAVQLALGPSYDVVTAESGEEAVRLCRERHPDIALVDLLMPGGGGFDVLAQVSCERQAPRVVFFTATNDCRKAAQAIQLGAADYLVKPCSGAQLRGTIEAVLSACRACA